mgnify:CR=1 FL=1
MRMLCQNCQKRIANVHFTQIINNKKIDMYLCEKCASEKGQVGFISALAVPFNISSFLSGLMGGAGANAAQFAPHVPDNFVCDKCGMSFEEFQSTGKIGCGKCYEIYGERLKPILRRLHGGTEHVGKMPARVSKDIRISKEVNKLKEMLNKAIQDEEYEKAAEIRDRIKAMESGA